MLFPRRDVRTFHMHDPAIITEISLRHNSSS